jgi:hypothetical protein
VFIILAKRNATFRIGKSTVMELVNRIKLFTTVRETVYHWMFLALRIVMVI